jgi:hypothetical protein
MKTNKYFLTVLSSLFLLTIPNTSNANAFENNNNNKIEYNTNFKDNNNFIGTDRSYSSTNMDGSSGSYGMYIDETRWGAPWALPDSIYVTRYYNGHTYRGTLYYNYSVPLGPTPIIANHVVIGHYTGYIY